MTAAIEGSECSTPRPHFTSGEDPVPIVQEAGWAPGTVWTGGISRPQRDSIPDRPAQSVYRLSYPADAICIAWENSKVKLYFSEISLVYLFSRLRDFWSHFLCIWMLLGDYCIRLFCVGCRPTSGEVYRLYIVGLLEKFISVNLTEVYKVFLLWFP